MVIPFSQLSHTGFCILINSYKSRYKLVQVNINTHPRAAGKLPGGNLGMKLFVQTQILLTDQIRQANILQESATFAKSWPRRQVVRGPWNQPGEQTTPNGRIQQFYGFCLGCGCYKRVILAASTRREKTKVWQINVCTTITNAHALRLNALLC